MQTTWQRLKDNLDHIEYLRKRERIVDSIRSFFKNDGFLEVDTPLMVKSPGTEPYLEVFETTLLDSNRNPKRAFLLTSPEYALKKLLVAGIPKLFQICKSFRNAEGISHKHNPEFTIMEWYRTNANYEDIMRDCENLFVHLAKQMSNVILEAESPAGEFDYRGSLQSSMTNSQKILGPSRHGIHGLSAKDDVVSWGYQGKTYDLTPPWERISVSQAFEKYCGIDVETMLDEEKIKTAGKARGFSIDSTTTWEQMYNQFFLNDIEPHLGVDRPTIIYDFPVTQASLSKRKDSDPRFAERFEFYVAGIEMGNAFSELTDANEQRRRFQAELAEREALGKTKYDLDEDYVAAIKAGLPPTGGIAVGIDRIVMFFADAANIKDVVVFPAEELWQ